MHHGCHKCDITEKRMHNTLGRTLRPYKPTCFYNQTKCNEIAITFQHKERLVKTIIAFGFLYPSTQCKTGLIIYIGVVRNK